MASMVSTNKPQFAFTWPQRISDIMQYIVQLKLTSINIDPQYTNNCQAMTLVSDDGITIECDRTLLLAASSYLRKKIGYPKDTGEKVYLFLADLDGESLTLLMEYINVGEVYLNEDQMKKVVIMAEKYELRGKMLSTEEDKNWLDEKQKFIESLIQQQKQKFVNQQWEGKLVQGTSMTSYAFVPILNVGHISAGGELSWGQSEFGRALPSPATSASTEAEAVMASDASSEPDHELSPMDLGKKGTDDYHGSNSPKNKLTKPANATAAAKRDNPMLRTLLEKPLQITTKESGSGSPPWKGKFQQQLLTKYYPRQQQHKAMNGTLPLTLQRFSPKKIGTGTVKEALSASAMTDEPMDLSLTKNKINDKNKNKGPNKVAKKVQVRVVRERRNSSTGRSNNGIAESGSPGQGYSLTNFPQSPNFNQVAVAVAQIPQKTAQVKTMHVKVANLANNNRKFYSPNIRKAIFRNSQASKFMAPVGYDKPRLYRTYLPEQMNAAIDEIQIGGGRISVLQIAKKYNIPPRTLYDKLKKSNIAIPSKRVFPIILGPESLSSETDDRSTTASTTNFSTSSSVKSGESQNSNTNSSGISSLIETAQVEEMVIPVQLDNFGHSDADGYKIGKFGTGNDI